MKGSSVRVRASAPRESPAPAGLLVAEDGDAYGRASTVLRPIGARRRWPAAPRTRLMPMRAPSAAERRGRPRRRTRSRPSPEGHAASRSRPGPLLSSAERACREPAGPSPLDLDLPPLRPLGLRHAHRKHAVAERRLDLVALDVVGQCDAVVETAGAPGLTTQHAATLALLDLAADRQLVADELHVDVVALHARQVGLDDVGVVGLLDVDEGRPAQPVGRRETAAERLVEQPPHPVGHLVEVAKRIPPLRGRPGSANLGKQRHRALTSLSVASMSVYPWG